MKKWVLIFISILMMPVLAVPALAEAGTAEAAQGSAHSAYTVEFTYEGCQYVMPGDSTVRLSEILDGVGLTGAVEAVEVSDERLFSASNETGEWIVTAHQVFSSMEWMKVTINGVAYEIAVTDDQKPVSYIDADGYTQTCETYTTLTANNTVWTGWVVTGSDVTISSRVMVSDEATLILCDGVVLTCAQGIDAGDHKLTVFVQSVGDGKLVANAPAQTTAIYGNVAICGSIIEAKGA